MSAIPHLFAPSSFLRYVKKPFSPFQQGVAITGRKTTGPPCSVGRPTAHAPGGRPARPPVAFPHRKSIVSWQGSHSVIFVLIYFLVLVFVFVLRIFFSFSFVLVFIIFFVFVVVLVFLVIFFVLLSFYSIFSF